jgi:hypothetical protein
LIGRLIAATRPIAFGPAPSSAAFDYDATRIGNYTFETALRELERQAAEQARQKLRGARGAAGESSGGARYVRRGGAQGR